MQKNGLTVLIVSEKGSGSLTAGTNLEASCERLVEAFDGEMALELMAKEHIDVVFTELNLGGQYNGIELLERIKESYSAEVIIIATSPTLDACKDAIRKGAYDFLSRPLERGQIEELIEQLAEEAKATASETAVEVSVRPKRVKIAESAFDYEGLRGSSAAMKRVFKVLSKVAPTDISVLIQGESGTGKELIARAIHLNSARRNGVFRPVNCAGLSETLLESELFGHVKGSFTGAASDRKGLFEAADNGTLFLDEIGDMPLNMQAKLLRVLEDGLVLPVGSNKPISVDVRIVSATNCDLAKLVEEKKFRQDLYFRIKGVSITLPPLRGRREDMPELVYYFLEQFSMELGIETKNISERAMFALINYDWPGNIRQLINAIRMMIVISDSQMIDIQDLPPEVYSQRQLKSPQAEGNGSAIIGKPLEEIEKEAIIGTLDLVEGNREKAAKILGIGARTLYRKLKDYED